MTDLILKVSGVGAEEWPRCQKVARQFMEEFPERMGIRDGCLYHNPGSDWPSLYVYRTKTAVVVRGCST